MMHDAVPTVWLQAWNRFQTIEYISSNYKIKQLAFSRSVLTNMLKRIYSSYETPFSREPMQV